ncbi:MAG: hypothetical protein ACI9NI_001555 [Olleya marilimosa]|jgi:hypothetical protein|uniref:Uncharacterized protein n=1 Tax=Olleya marilimosa TaxID=272164 RepID=A0ABR8LW58_9FLAO|nr:hypothetical protein [Olleya marilimosa]MBD3864411.1 hypothetical protein [Olleya marilimosa]MBD3891891.1 hypothetical protein [Olleya marilimosa]PIB31056.1 hypothetical protein BFP78_12445 [Gaetbulibacter sp. 5U11]|tara:strand:+ start:11339 stop:11632 length:294 start_codon:yes stop_codon:yes gene_type:complete
MLEIINQVFSIQLKSNKENLTLFNRNIDRINHELESLGYHVINPIGQTYRNEMTDVEANITGDFNEQMKIVKVLKPIVYKKTNDQNTLVQKGIVIVE